MRVSDAQALAEELLAGDLPQRWRHVQGVAARAHMLHEELRMPDHRLLMAAWLHDVGYSPSLLDTGFHSLDGGRYLLRSGVDPVVASLVAHHSWAIVEAELRGLLHEMDEEFPKHDSLIGDALCYCDMTIGPDGSAVSVHERLTEIRTRYGKDHVVTRFVDRAAPQIIASVGRVETLRRAA
jgi:hypothetical protein